MILYQYTLGGHFGGKRCVEVRPIEVEDRKNQWYNQWGNFEGCRKIWKKSDLDKVVEVASNKRVMVSAMPNAQLVFLQKLFAFEQAAIAEYKRSCEKHLQFMQEDLAEVERAIQTFQG